MNNRNLPGIQNASTKFAQKLRRESTSSEQILSDKLRNKQMSGLKFRRQEPIGPYIADFFCFRAKLIIELDGLSHSDKKEYDENREAYFEKNGYCVLRFLNDQVSGDLNMVLETIELSCARNVLPPPSLPQRGRR